MTKANIVCALTLATLFSTTSTAASGCEKWKSDIAGLAFNLGSYISAYDKYARKKTISYEEFRAETDKLIAKVKRVQMYAQSTESCSHPEEKFARRRDMILSTTKTALPIMVAGQFLAPEIKYRLNKETETDQ